MGVKAFQLLQLFLEMVKAFDSLHQMHAKA